MTGTLAGNFVLACCWRLEERKGPRAGSCALTAGGSGSEASESLSSSGRSLFVNAATAGISSVDNDVWGAEPFAPGATSPVAAASVAPTPPLSAGIEFGPVVMELGDAAGWVACTAPPMLMSPSSSRPPQNPNSSISSLSKKGFGAGSSVEARGPTAVESAQSLPSSLEPGVLGSPR